MKKEKNGKFRFLMGTSLFLLFMGTASLSFSQYRTTGDQKDTFSTTQENVPSTTPKQKNNTGDPSTESVRCMYRCLWLVCAESPDIPEAECIMLCCTYCGGC